MAELTLTTEQKAVVNDRGGTLLVSAAAGSGKTKVLIDRVLKRVEEEQVDIDRFLLITFTQAAASELRGKLIAQLGERLAKRPDDRHLQRQLSRVYLAQISTVHAFCAAILRDYVQELEFADFRIADEQEAAVLRERALQETLEKTYETLSERETVEALDMFGAGRDDSQLPAYILKLYESLQCFCDVDGHIAELRQKLDLAQYADAGKTDWGAYLLGELRVYLNGCIDAMEQAVQTITRTPSLANYLPTFLDNIAMLRSLGQQMAWEDVRAFQPDFGRLKGVKEESDEKDRVKAVRKRVMDGVRDRLKIFQRSSDDALAELSECAGALRGLIGIAERFASRYRAEKLRRHVLDYDDLEHEALRLLTVRGGTPTAAAREISRRYLEIMVDEYQDTNAVQDAIFHAISQDGRNLFLVGDVKQSIYRFRLADPTIFLKKYREFVDYTAAADGEPRKILLSDNFRSGEAILDAANDVFRLTMTERVGGLRYGDAEALRFHESGQARLHDPAVELHCIDMEGLPEQPPLSRAQIEAEFVARRLEKMLQTGETIPDGDRLRPIRAEDVAILLRSFAGKAQIYLEALRRHGIACVCGSGDLFDSEEILILSALMQILDNPHQDIPLLTVLFSPLFRFSADDLARFRAASRTGDLLDALAASGEAEEFLNTLGQLRDLAQTATLRTLLDEIDERLFLRAIFGAMDDGARRIAHFDRFFALADSYEQGERRGLPGFLRYLDTLRQNGLREDDTPVAGAVRLMTVHKSKGLEFPVVFLADLGKRFNIGDASEPILVDPELGIGANVYDTKKRVLSSTIAATAISARIRREEKSEEMRVLYVAMTRPRHRLIMTCCARSLRSRVKTLARELHIPPDAALLEGAGSMGDWVILTALTHTEAGALFSAAEACPDCSGVVRNPWKITWQTAGDCLPGERSAEVARREDASELLRPSFPVYPHRAASTAPSKLTATQLKGRPLDGEVSENAPVPKPKLIFQKPRLQTDRRPLTPAERGTAIHLAMQYIRYEACTSLPGVEDELRRLVERRFLTQQQADAVPAERILRFFASELGQRVLRAKRLVREFKFSVLEDASTLSPELAGEEVLLQGVTDCCLLEEDGLTILDFKSDRVDAAQLPERARYYRGQLDAYSRALSRIFGLPVKECILYFFHADRAISVSCKAPDLPAE